MTSSMLTERRWSSARRGGMTTLGKVAVPKPINLPSQRLESHGLKQTEEVLPKFTLSWGNRSSTSASNVWGSSTPSSNTENGNASPSHLSGRPSSGGTTDSDRTHQSGSDNRDPNSRPPSANAALTSNQLLAISLRPHSADTRPGSSKLTRFADSNDNTMAWGTTDKWGATNSKNCGFSLSSGDFPTLGSDRDTHSRPGSSSSGVRLARERTGASPTGDVFANLCPQNGSGKIWRDDASHDGFRGSMEMWKGERYSYQNANMPPPGGPQTNTGDVYRPDISDRYNRPGMPSRPVFDPREGSYGMGYSNERDISFMGPGRGVYNRMASNYSRSALVSEPMEPGHLQDLRGKYTVLLEPSKAWNLEEEEQALEHAVPVSTSSLEKADQATSRESDWIRDDHKDDDSDSQRVAADEFSSYSVDIVNAVDELAVKESDIFVPSKIVETPRDSTLIQKIKGLNAKSYVSGKEEQQLKSEVGSTKISHPLYEDGSGALSHNRALATGTISPVTGVATRDKSIETSANETLFSRKVILGPHGRVAQHRGKGWFNSQEANAWQKKALTSETTNGHRLDHQITVGATEKSGSFLQGKADVEFMTSIPDPNDMQVQRAAMRERAKQRAEQLKKEEEERTREQKAKALTKLEELNRRSQASESSMQKLGNLLPRESTISTNTGEAPNSNCVSNANHTVECTIISNDLPIEAPKYTNQVPAVTNNWSSPMKSEIDSAGDDTVTYADDSASKQKQTSYKQMLEVPWETSPKEKTSFGAIEVTENINESEKRMTPYTEVKVVSEVAAGCKSSTPSEPTTGTSTAVVPNPVLVLNNYLATHNSVSISNRVVVESAMTASKKTDKVSVTPKRSSTFEQIVNSASVAANAVSPLYSDDDVLKLKQTSYEQKLKTPLEMIPTEKPTSGSIEAPNIINESDMKATPAIEVTSWYQSSIPVIPNVMPEPYVDQRGKNGRCESKQEETPPIVDVPDHRYAANSLFGNGEQEPADWDLDPNPFEPVSITKDAVQSIESNDRVINNQWETQNLHPRSQQVNRSMEKFNGGVDAVVWPPNKDGNNDGTSNKTVHDEESSLTTRRDIPAQNNLNSNGTEVERCVRASVAKDVAQQISIPQPISPPHNKISSDEFVRRDESDAQSAGNTQPFEIVVGKIRISTGPINWDNKQIKENGLWYLWGATESTHMQVIQDGSSILLKLQTDVQEPVDHNQTLMKPDLPSEKEVETMFSDGWNNPDEWNTMDNSNLVASVSSSIPKDQKFRSRERRQTYKGRMGTGNNNTCDIDHKNMRIGNKNNNAFVDRSTSQWQPKSRTYSSQNQRGGRPSGSQNVTTEVTVKRESAPKGSGEATNVGHQDLKREKKALSVKGAPNEGSLDHADSSSNEVLGSQHDQQLLSSGFRKNGNQNNRYVRGNESRRDWNSTGQDGKQHNQPSIRERQMNIIGPHTSNKSNNFEGPMDESSSSRFRERGQDEPMRGTGNPLERQSGTERVDAAYDYWRTKYNTGLFDFSKFLYTLKPPGALSMVNGSEENTIGTDKGFF